MHSCCDVSPESGRFATVCTSGYNDAGQDHAVPHRVWAGAGTTGARRDTNWQGGCKAARNAAKAATGASAAPMAAEALQCNVYAKCCRHSKWKEPQTGVRTTQRAPPPRPTHASPPQTRPQDGSRRTLVGIGSCTHALAAAPPAPPRCAPQMLCTQRAGCHQCLLRVGGRVASCWAHRPWPWPSLPSLTAQAKPRQ